MNRWLVILIGGVFVLASGTLIAQGVPAVKSEDTAKLKAEKQAAEQAEAKMTPEEKAAAKKAKRAKKQKEMAHAEKTGNPNASARGEAIEKSAETTKDQPKLDTKAKQEALKGQEKKASGQ